MIVPVILCGGSGTRLWPMSRELYPKQLLSLVGEQSLLQATLSRLEGISDLDDPILVCNEEHRFMVAEQLRQSGIEPKGIILEPVGRNTGPAAAVSALMAAEKGNDPTLLVLPADHIIQRPEAFQQAVGIAQQASESGGLITFGVVPDRPETGFGYIKVEGLNKALGSNEPVILPVLEFVEKPDAPRAKEYLESGRYFWNSGMFMFKASRYLEELESVAPDMVRHCRAAYGQGSKDLDFFRLEAESFRACPKDSIDYAVMEKTRSSQVVPLNAGWNDVGSWSALWEIDERDEHGNVCKGDVLVHDASECYLASNNRLLVGIGLKGVVVVETTDAVLVADMHKDQEVKAVVEALKSRDRGEVTVHRRVYRPWGSYENVDAGERFQVKRIIVNPGSVLSLQMHHHRAEHWVVVRGTARIVQGDKEYVLSEDQSTYIPLGTLHRLENPGKIPLELIEVQTGSYLGEDDIIRYQDNYGRRSSD